jgi:hypothetical protein
VRLVEKTPAVGDKQIKIAVIVVVEKRGPPRPPGIADAAEVCLVGEGAVAVVPIETVTAVVLDRGGVIDQGRNEPVQPSVAIEVANSGSHPVLVGAHARGDGAVGERPVAIVPKQLAGLEITGNRQVWVAVAIEVGKGR